MLLTLAAAATALVSLPRAPLATLPVPRAAVSMNADSWENELRQGLRAAQSNGIAFGKARKGSRLRKRGGGCMVDGGETVRARKLRGVANA